MIQYFMRRLLLMIPTLFGITIVVFIIIQSAPGGPVEQAMQAISGNNASSGVSGDLTLTDEMKENIKKQFGFDKPILVRYGNWVKNMATGDFGDSYVHEEPVLKVIASKFPVSLQFGLTSILLSYLVCIPLGIAKALKDKSVFDYVTSIIIFLGHSTPGFVLGILLVVFLGGGSFFNVFPIGGIHSDNYETLTAMGKILDRLHHAVLPVLCYMVSHFAVLTMLTKNSLIGELRKDYIKTAIAKGVEHFWVIYKHALRNALIPVATGIGGVFSIIFAGSLLIETVFNLDGIGLLTYTSVLKRDYPLIMASVTIHSLLIMFGNLFSDMVLGVIDPRIDFE